jgi:DeoR family glycerol-3-phosphate regulon repressor
LFFVVSFPSERVKVTGKEANSLVEARQSKRHREIVDVLRDRGTCEISELARFFKVSTETIRRDVKPLTDSGRLVKMHGAVALADHVLEAPFERRMRENADVKQAIAAVAAAHIKNGDSIMMDTGTTTSFLARELLKRQSLTVVTNSSDIARTLATVNGNTVYMAGGELRGDNGAAFGSSAIEFVSRFKVGFAVISITAIDAEAGLMDLSLEEAEFARMVLSCGRHRMVVSDSSKFGHLGLVEVCGFDRIHRLITDEAPPEAVLQALKGADVFLETLANHGGA